MDWLKKLVEYAPDIVTAIASGGATLPVMAIKAVSKELLGVETDDIKQVKAAVEAATPEEMIGLTKANNTFKIEMQRLENQDKQAEHSTTQDTIKNGDNSEYAFVRFTRPGQSWVSLAAAIYYMIFTASPSIEISAMLMALPLSYAGLRQIGKWKTASTLKDLNKG